ncbi:hypothetical protein ML462_15835 [Gramella lutea]|uniref:Uncharacterized protein n=1 Tax=Christiangramia lutea TaxID=1607951 RepID=A0A9X1V6A8_9FLAO|nr:hypothetical protein [Christiangramia lutea]MCH4824645.1 hypothetical protein [Christiangramia lutea]
MDKHNLNSDNPEDILKEALPKNSWLIDESIPHVKHLNDYNSIIEDLKFARECLIELKKMRVLEENTEIENSTTLKRVYFTNSVITYARCFNSTKQGGRISINKKQFKKNFPNNERVSAKDLVKFHEYIMDLRNKFIAHADNSIFETKRIYIQFELEGENLHSTFANLSVAMFNFDQTQLSNFMVLIDYAIINLSEKSKILTQKVKDQIGDDKLLEVAIKTLKNN